VVKDKKEHDRRKLTKEEGAAIYRWLTERWGLSPKAGSQFLDEVRDKLPYRTVGEAFMEVWTFARREYMLQLFVHVKSDKYDERQKELFMFKTGGLDKEDS